MNLNQLFDIAHTDAEKMMKFQEDIDFLQAQREDGRRGAMIGIDRVTTMKEKAMKLKEEKYVKKNRTE